MEDKKEIGKIIHFFPKINVAIIELTEPLSVGDKIWVKGAETDLEQTVESMQIEHQNIQKGEKGQAVGLKVIGRVREADRLHK